MADERNTLTRAEDALWASLPGRLWPRTSGLALMLADGGWLRARGGIALVVPALAFLLGLARGGWRAESEFTYGYSLVWLLVMVAVALLGCGPALWLWVGYVLGDLLVFDHPQARPQGRFFGDATLWDQVQQLLVPQAISYLLLAVLLISTPLMALLARGSVMGLLGSLEMQARLVFGAIAAAVAAGINAGLWTQAYPLLIRPIWTWHGRFRSPDVAGIAPVQQNPIGVALVAAAVAALVAVLSALALRQITGKRYQPIAQPKSETAWSPMWKILGAMVKAGLVVLLIAGLVGAWWQAWVAIGALFVVFVAQNLLLPRTPAAKWWTAKLPAVLRLAVAAAISWLVAWQIGSTAYDTRFGRTVVTTDSFDPLLWAVVGAIAAMALLMPAPAPEHQEVTS